MPPIAIRVALDSPRTLWIPMDSPNVYQSSSYLVNASLLPLSFSSFLNLLAFNLFRERVVEGSGHSPRPRCSKLLGGNARFTCSQKYPKILWECLGHCSELLQIKWDLRIECGSASEIDQTSYKPEMVLKWLVGILIHECKSAILLDISTSSILFIFIPCHTFVALALTSLHWSK